MDAIFLRFLEASYEEATKLAAESDVLRLVPMPPHPPSAYVCDFLVPHLRRTDAGTVEISRDPVLAGIRFPEDYLRSADPHLSLKVASLLDPPSLVHPNVKGGIVCLGSAFGPGTRISLLLGELYDIFSYRNYSLVEAGSLNPEACRLLRAHPQLLDELRPEPLRRRQKELKIQVSHP